MFVRGCPSVVVSSQLMVMRMDKCSLAREVETDQSDSSAMSLEAKLMSGEADRPFVGSRIPAKNGVVGASISSASCSSHLSSLVFASHLE